MPKFTMTGLTRTWLPIVGAAAVLTLVFALLALVLYTRTEQGVVEKHSQDQRLLARLGSRALAQRVDEYFHGAETSADRLHGLPEEEWREALPTLPPVFPGKNVFLLYGDGRLEFQRPPAAPGGLEEAVRPWQGASEPVLTDPFPPEGEEREAALLLPLPPGAAPRAQLGFTLPFDPLLETLLGAPAGSGHSFNVSLLNEDGRVLANMRHPEMEGRKLPEPGETCQPCHTSFAVERRMVAGESGVERLQVGDEPLALVAFAPVELLGRRWSLALSEPYTAIIADTRQGFRGITLLLGLSLVVGIAATALTLQNRAQRRRAEERARQVERRAALERRLRQSEQLASIGKMTSQIAHEINTPLAALGLNVAYLRTEVSRHAGEGGAGIEEVSDAIAAEIERLRRVVDSYLRFSRLPKAEPARTSLRALVESFLEFVENEARERRVELEADLGSERAEANLDADLFRQAFLNLVRNSFEAMPGGGTLRVSLREVEGELVLQVADSGRGIPEECLGRIFDPFFTTKKSGTGLGLAHTRRVIEEHGGLIEVASRPGQGTTFSVRLPALTSSESETESLLTAKGR